uniref:Uncharacterized protein n=1 Tax=Malurus cyaneus samueli TaxID=2593467 RepID=A0A8C5X536_9PASS
FLLFFFSAMVGILAVLEHLAVLEYYLAALEYLAVLEYYLAVLQYLAALEYYLAVLEYYLAEYYLAALEYYFGLDVPKKVWGFFFVFWVFFFPAFCNVRAP